MAHVLDKILTPQARGDCGGEENAPEADLRAELDPGQPPRPSRRAR